MKSGLTNLHQKIAEEMDLPDFVKEIKCPHCFKDVELNGIRTIAICLNARNLGDISVEYHCKSCGLMDTLYYRKAVEDKVKNFSEYINNEKKPLEKPVVEEEMYKLGYNNLVERFLEEKKS